MASSSSSNPFHFASLSLVCFFFFFFFFSENKSFVSAIREEAISTELQHTHHLVPLSSLLPSSTCSSPPQGATRKGSLEVVHKHGPCSKLRQHQDPSPLKASLIIPHPEILEQDQARVRSIHSKFSGTQNHGEEEQAAKEVESSKGLGQDQLPAKSGTVLGTGNYFVTVGLGSPKRELSLIFDTGSDLTWTQCEPCAGSCYSQKETIFDPSHSTSYSNISCSSSQCSLLSSATGNVPKCSRSTGACIYGIQYGDSSFSIGYFAQEALTITPTDVVDSFLFGCGQNNQGLFGGTAGLLGLGRNPISFIEQTAQKYHKIFSYCLPSTPSTVGYLAFGGGGGYSSGSVKYTPFSSISRSSSFYGLDVIGISLAGTKLPISASMFSPGTIIDSGTIITRLPPAAYGPLRDAFRKAMSRYPKADPVSILDTCYDLSGYKNAVVPRVTLSFAGEVNLELNAVGVLYAVSETKSCLAFAPNQDASDVAILGNVQQKTMEVVYDVGGGKIGFRSGGCK